METITPFDDNYPEAVMEAAAQAMALVGAAFERSTREFEQLGATFERCVSESEARLTPSERARFAELLEENGGYHLTALARLERERCGLAGRPRKRLLGPR